MLSNAFQLDSYYTLVNKLSASDRILYLADCIYRSKRYIKQQQEQQRSQWFAQNIQAVATTGESLIQGQFKLFSQNVAGLLNNRDLLFQLVSLRYYDCIALQETHMASMPVRWNQFFKAHGYTRIVLDARRFASAGRYCGGMLVLLKTTMPLTSVLKSYTDFGETVEVTLNGQCVLHFIYRNPSTCLKLLAQAFTVTLNSSQQHLFVGDLNLELLNPDPTTHTTSNNTGQQPIAVATLATPKPSATKAQTRVCRQATKILNRFPLHVLTPFTSTHVKGRCIDMILSNTVAVNQSCATIHSTVGSNYDLSSDHKSVSVGINLVLGWASDQPQGVSLRLGYKALHNDNIQMNAMTYYFAFMTSQAEFIPNIPASIGLAALSCIVFCCYTIAEQQLANVTCAPPPTYCLVYRNYRNIVAQTPTLSAQRAVLKANRYKFNIINGCALQRNLVKTSFYHLGFMRVLAKGRAETHLQVQQDDITHHFSTFLNRQCHPPPVCEDFLQDFKQLNAAQISKLQDAVTLQELQFAAKAISNRSSTGTFGLNASIVLQLLENPLVGAVLVSLINDWISTDSATSALFLVMLSAIPKAGKPPTSAKNLRPISVTSIWYRLVAKVFTQRLSDLLPTIYSPNQHGFCPSRSVQTALTNLLCTLEWAKGKGDDVYMMQIDVDKAYDSVHRPAFSSILEFIGIAKTPLFDFIMRGLELGQVSVCGPRGMGQGFCTSRGIRQGCPASPALFAAAISGLERRLSRLLPTTGWSIKGLHAVFTGYADDIKLVAKSPQELSVLFAEVQRFLAYLGLQTSAAKCKVLVVSPTRHIQVQIQDQILQVEPELRFLGVRIGPDGTISAWKRDYDIVLSALWQRIKDVGLNQYPAALVRAFQIFIQPGLTFGCEIWGITEVTKVIRGIKSPYTSAAYHNIISKFKAIFGLGVKSFAAPMWHVLGLKTLFAVACRQIITLWQSLEATLQQSVMAVADLFPASRCADLCFIVDSWAASGLPIKLYIQSIEKAFWESHGVESRHSQFYNTFGNQPTIWTCFTEQVSFSTTRGILRFLCLSHKYFYSRQQQCSLCGKQCIPSLAHILYDCEATTKVCETFNMPSVREFGRIHLLQQSGVELLKFFQALEEALDVSFSNQQLKKRATQSPLVLTKRVKWTQFIYECTFDGSYQMAGAGVGMCIQEDGKHIVQASIPVATRDAQRTEAMGPVLLSLVLALLPPGMVRISGDSQYVCGLLNREYQATDIFLYNCIQLVQDMLGTTYPYTCSWIPRESNSTCDLLARKAVGSKTVELFVNRKLGTELYTQVLDVLQLCIKYFVQRF